MPPNADYVPVMRTWWDVARSAVWYTEGRDIGWQEAEYLLWERSCYPFGTSEQVYDQLAHNGSSGTA